MTISLIRQLKGDIERTCQAYQADAHDNDTKLAIQAIQEEASRTAQTAIATLKQNKAGEQYADENIKQWQKEQEGENDVA
jgi:hypothetical protein